MSLEQKGSNGSTREWSMQWATGLRTPGPTVISGWERHGIAKVGYEVLVGTIPVPGIDITALRNMERVPKVAYVVTSHYDRFNIVIVDALERVPKRYRKADEAGNSFMEEDVMMIDLEGARIIQPYLNFTFAHDNRFRIYLESLP